MSHLDYLNMLAKPTISNYMSALRDFFEMVYGAREPLEDLAARYVQGPREYEKDIQEFLVKLNGRPPKTMRLKLSAVKTFLIENKIDLPESFWRRTTRRIKGSRARTNDRPPSKDELRRIITHMPQHGKALYLVLASSGMRKGEALQLTMDDIALDQEPVEVNIRGSYTKSGNKRWTFISSEARDAVEEWLKVRDDYLEAACAKSHLFEKDRDDPRLFPFQSSTAHLLWSRALSKSEHDEVDPETNRHIIHPHSLRKFFRSNAATVIPADVVEALMGHEAYLTEVYRKYRREDLAKFYQRAEHTLHVFGRPEELGKLKEGQDQQQTIINGLVAENVNLKEEMRKLKEQFLTKMVADTKKQMEAWKEDSTKRQDEILGAFMQASADRTFRATRAGIKAVPELTEEGKEAFIKAFEKEFREEKG